MSAASPVTSTPIARTRRFGELVSHLALREITATHRFTLLGWIWPLARLLVQAGVLVLIFSGVLDIGVDFYPAFVLSGLLAWSWFSSGLGRAAGVLVEQRHLVFQPGFPSATLPAVAVAVPLIDLLIALPVLAVVLLLGPGIQLSVLALPLLIAVQAVLMCGLAWLVASLNVFFRDLQQIVVVAVATLFYLTPVFYPLTRVPEEYRWLIELNPMSTLVDGYQGALVDGSLPSPGALAIVAAAGVAIALLGLTCFRRLERTFVDEL